MSKTALRIVMPALIAALLLSGQVALAIIPNVEVVTLIVIVSAYVFSPGVTIIAVLVFCTGEWLIYGFGYWVVSYYIYWPLLTAVSLILKLLKNTWLRNIIAVLIAAVLTTFFGVMTSAVDTVVVSGFNVDFFDYFPIIYIRGAYFYIVHIVSNSITIGCLFTPLSLALKRIKLK